VSPADFFPELRPWVENLITVWPAYIIKPQFAVWQVFHILSLALIGGVAILMNLRLMGLGLTEETPSEMRRNLWGWMHLAVAGIIISGILIGMANAERLYDSTAFTVKMIALLAGVVFTYGVTGPVAARDGTLSRTSAAFALAGVAIWAFGLWIFVGGSLINPGMFHVLTAAGLIVALAVRGRMRLVYLAGTGLIAAVHFAVTHFVIGLEDLQRADPFNIGFAWALSLWLLGWAIFGAMQRHVGNTRAPVRAAAYVGILIWVSAAAAGRWIAFA
jgi:hypothetical protein